jgi:chromosome segregation ATPase
MEPKATSAAGQDAPLREQLILAQVRLMELEDERDAALARIAGVERLLGQAQALADTAKEERGRAHAEAAARISELEQARATLASATEQLEQTRATLRHTEEALAQSRLACEEHQRALQDAERMLAGLRASRSWRWTAWLRSLEKLFGAE